MQRTMPHDAWLKLSESGQHICRYVKCAEGEIPPQLAHYTVGEIWAEQKTEEEGKQEKKQQQPQGKL